LREGPARAAVIIRAVPQSDPFDAAPLCCLVGPTASGKTEVALDLALRSGAEIISLDSMLVYRGIDIGTAKPTPEERARVPHHMVDVVDPSERYDVQRYLRAAARALEGVLSRGRRALFVGGTGFYLAALLRGLFEGPPIDPDLRGELEERARTAGGAELHARLASIDATAAERIHPNDTRRVVRALEVYEQTGRTLTDWQREWASPSERVERARLVGLRPEPARLEERIARRTRAMLSAGWCAEAVAIRSSCGFGPSAIQALGYREVLELADGVRTETETAELIALRTRQFARRQRTWYRKFAIEWFAAPEEADARAATVAAARKAFGW